MCRASPWPHTAHPDVVCGTPTGVAHAPEHLTRCSKVAEHNAVEHDYRDDVLPPRASWLDSYGYWAFLPLADHVAMSKIESMILMDVLGPAIGAGVFVSVMSLVREPTRRTLNAVIGRGVRRVPQRWLWRLGDRLPCRRDASGLSRAPVVSLHRRRMADARGLGLATPLLGEPDMAIHAVVVLRLLRVRLAHRYVVPGRLATWSP
jgi:hypothetical protein